MFCPKCGTKNPDEGKFCRSCGTGLGVVSAALTGNLQAETVNPGVVHLNHEAKRRQDANEVYGDGIRNILTGIGFLVVAFALLTTNVAGGKTWWWAMLFPAFGMLGKGVSDYLKSKRMTAEKQIGFDSPPINNLNQPAPIADLPPSQTEYVPPAESRFKTGDLAAPPSVTETTTRQLELNNEGETMTLPKKQV